MQHKTESNRLPALAAEIRKAHEGVQEAAQSATERAMEAGQALIEAKGLLKHGEWLPWLKEHCALSDRTAQTYMRLARKTGEMSPEKTATVAGLPVREAMKAIADRDACPTLPPAGADDDAIWAWIEGQLAAPLNAHDLDHHELLKQKLLRQIGMPTTPHMLLTVNTNIPLLTLASEDDLDAALNCLVPITQDKKARALDIDFSGLTVKSTRDMLNMIDAIVCWLCGVVLNEMDRRLKMDPVNEPEAYCTEREKERQNTLAEWRAGAKFAEERNARFKEDGNHEGLAKVGTFIPRHKSRPASRVEAAQ